MQSAQRTAGTSDSSFANVRNVVVADHHILPHGYFGQSKRDHGGVWLFRKKPKRCKIFFSDASEITMISLSAM